MNELQAAQEKLDKLQNELAAQQKIVDDLKAANEWPKTMEQVRNLYAKFPNHAKAENMDKQAHVKESIENVWDIIGVIENDLTWVERANKCDRWSVVYGDGKFTTSLFKHGTHNLRGIEFSCSTKEKAEHLITYFSELLKQAMMI